MDRRVPLAAMLIAVACPTWAGKDPSAMAPKADPPAAVTAPTTGDDDDPPPRNVPDDAALLNAIAEGIVGKERAPQLIAATRLEGMRIQDQIAALGNGRDAFLAQQKLQSGDLAGRQRLQNSMTDRDIQVWKNAPSSAMTAISNVVKFLQTSQGGPQPPARTSPGATPGAPLSGGPLAPGGEGSGAPSAGGPLASGNTGGVGGAQPPPGGDTTLPWQVLDGYSGGHPTVLRNLGQQQFKSRDFRGSYDTYTRLMGQGANDAEVRRMRGLSAHRLGDFERGHADAKEALKVDPNDQIARELLNMTKDRVSTIRLPNASALSDSKGGADDGGLGPRLASAGLAGAGLRAPAGAIDPGMILAAVQARGGDPAQASRHLVQEAQSAWRVGDANAAIVLASKALELDGKSPAAYAVRALARNHLGEYPSAAQDASSSLALLPPGHAAGVLGARAWAFNSMRRHDDALKDSLQARQIKPRDGFLLLNEARALGGLGKRGEMIERLREAAALEPAKFKPVLEQAVMLPNDADTELLFTRMGGASEAAAPGKGGASEEGGLGRTLRLLLYVAAGGLLLAFGFKRSGLAERITQSRALVPDEETTPTEVDAESPAPERPEAAPATAFLSRYDGVRELAKGGMGVVYEATDRGLARKVAIKKMREELRTDPRERERFLQEARTVAGLRHPNIVQIYQVAEDGMDAYLVFEHVDGETLHQRLQRAKRLTLAETTEVLRGVCAAVEHAHAHGLMHRDLKPSNIMIDREDVVKVMDFGIARQAKDAMTKLSMTNTVCGTPPYMAPEQEQGLVCKESDIFSLGVLAYEMLSGTLPFDGPPAAMLLAKMSARFEPLATKAPGLPPGAEAAVARALSQDPAKRWRKPGEFLAALEAVASAKPA